MEKIKLSLTFLLLILVISVEEISASGITIYVSPNGNNQNSGKDINQPLKDIQYALDKIPELKQEGEKNISIQLLSGTFFINKPLVLEPKHSGNKNTPVLIFAEKGANSVINGGREINGWKKQKNGLWVTKIPEVKAGEWHFNQLYVNGQLKQRAKTPNNGFLIVKGMPDGTPKTVGYHTDCQSFEFAEGDINPSWKNLDDVEVIVYHFWTDSHLPIQSIDKEKNIVTFKHKAGKVFTDDFSENGARYIVENVYEELDTPGEWYLDKKTGRCYYYPFPEEEIESTEFFAPLISKLVQFDGIAQNGNWVNNINFKNISFCYTNWELPVGNSNDNQGSASVPAAISLNGTHNCTFSNCEFYNLGTWAFELNKGCSDNEFTNNLISHIAAGGFRINGGTFKDHPFERTGRNTIKDNYIHHFGEVYPSAVGVLLQHTEGNLVSHNEIHNGFYTGISIGWVWGYKRSISRDNIIEFNHIYNIGQGLLSDMGAIYTLGNSPGTIIRNNLIHDVDANHYGGWGIYHDEGSTGILVENNIVYNTKFATFNIHYCKNVTVRNNIFAFGKLQQLNRTRSEPHKSVFFEQNIIIWKEGKLLDGKWKDFPHLFYYHPKTDGGTIEVSETFDMDYNLYFNPNLTLEQADFNGMTYKEWREAGKDMNSIYTDPLFVDAESYDFNLKQESPVFKLGFRPIDIESIGPRKTVGIY